MRSRPVAIAGVLAFVAAVGVSPAAQAPTIEYDVKAAVLLNFTRFVDWPPASRSGQAFGLCTLEPDPFGPRLETATMGEVWDGKPISVRRVTTVRNADCHLLYVSTASMTTFRNMLKELSQQSILTVGESSDFLDRGGMIQLFVESNRVRFSINSRTAQTAGLRIGSRLLRLAKEVVTKEVPPR